MGDDPQARPREASLQVRAVDLDDVPAVGGLVRLDRPVDPSHYVVVGRDLSRVGGVEEDLHEVGLPGGQWDANVSGR